MKVTEIISLSYRPGLYRVSVDSRPLGYVMPEDIFTLGLVLGRKLNDSEYQQLLATVKYTAWYGAAARYAMRRLRSKSEVVLYLARRDCDRQTASKIANKLEELGIIDEVKLAEAYVHDSLSTKFMSKKALELKLRQKNIDTEIIVRELESSKVQDTEMLDALIAKKKDMPSYANNKERLFRYLLNKGFRYEDISARIGRPGPKKRRLGL